MTTYANVGHILLKRGNTTQSAAYTGPVGEVTYDTGLKTLRVHDGSTAGGNVILVNQTTLTSYQTYANANSATQATSIDNITANIGSFYTYANLNYGTNSYANANVIAYLAGQNISSANIGGLYNSILGANTAWTANAASQAGSITSLTANAATQQSSIDSINANIGGFYIWANLTLSTVANAATQANSITTLQTQVYANANVATYLPTYSGNITAANISLTGNTGYPNNTATVQAWARVTIGTTAYWTPLYQ